MPCRTDGPQLQRRESNPRSLGKQPSAKPSGTTGIRNANCQGSTDALRCRSVERKGVEPLGAKAAWVTARPISVVVYRSMRCSMSSA